MPRKLSSFGIAAFSLIAVGCSSGPEPPKPGSPAFLWSAAKTTYAAGDFLQATQNLTQLAASDSEFATRSMPWAIMVSAGVAQGYRELADNYDAGAKANRANPTPFRRQAYAFRSQGSAAAMQCTEAVHKLLAGNPPETIALELGYPNGSAAEPVQLQRVSKGMLVPAAELEALQQAMVKRGVLLSVTQNVAGAADPAKAAEVFKQGEVKVSRAAFLQATAKALVELSDLFGSQKLDRPDRVTLLCNEAEQALKSIPATKETKDLMGRIAKMRKSGKAS